MYQPLPNHSPSWCKFLCFFEEKKLARTMNRVEVAMMLLCFEIVVPQCWNDVLISFCIYMTCVLGCLTTDFICTFWKLLKCMVQVAWIHAGYCIGDWINECHPWLQVPSSGGAHGSQHLNHMAPVTACSPVHGLAVAPVSLVAQVWYDHPKLVWRALRYQAICTENATITHSRGWARCVF